MQKIVINDKYGGFDLSPLGYKRFAELKGKPCYFFRSDLSYTSANDYQPLSLEDAEKSFMFFVFTVPDPNEYLKQDKDWKEQTLDERKEHNERYKTVHLYANDIERDDPSLVQVVEELGEKANGSCASLKIVEIPDGIKWAIEEYDGNEWVAEAHQTWS